ncbi:MAG: hypothetical protein D6753_18460 [Planctomycetota bacterium]|nr:MAG: hypothetical protein D6753_18460 [Planctomycetota bacterium]
MLVGRVVIYWLAGVAYLGLGIAFFEFLSDNDLTTAERFRSFAGQFLLWLPSLVLLLPLAIFDVVRVSHLFAGPIYRLRMHLASLAEDSDCRPLSFRADDYWQELADPINALQDKIQSLKQRVAELEQLQAEAGTATAGQSDATGTDRDETVAVATPESLVSTAATVENVG